MDRKRGGGGRDRLGRGVGREGGGEEKRKTDSCWESSTSALLIGLTLAGLRQIVSLGLLGSVSSGRWESGEEDEAYGGEQWLCFGCKHALTLTPSILTPQP